MNHNRKRCIRIVGVFLIFCLLCAVQVPIAAQRGDSAERGNAYRRLNSAEQILYDFLRPRVEEVARGERSSADFSVDADTLSFMRAQGLRTSWSSSELGITDLEMEHISEAFYAQFDLSKLMEALMNDSPFTMYWYDKTAGVAPSFLITLTSEEGLGTVGEVSELTFRFQVSRAYQAQGYDASRPVTDAAKTASASRLAEERALAIVERYADLKDYEKLEAYRDEICALTDYEHDEDDLAYYGDPWQITSVFDGDPDTRSVCEGYAKAFQYLCDLSVFQERVVCYTVKGMMRGGTGAGPHMWNTVEMGDGLRYLADITNSDDSTVGADGSLFLVGAVGSIADGYRCWANRDAVDYSYYDPALLALWGTEKDSILSVTDSDYVPPEISFRLPERLVYDGEAITFGREDADICYFFDGMSDSVATVSVAHTWHADQNGTAGAVLGAAPVNAGVYWLSVKAESKLFSCSRSVRFEIEQAEPAYTLPAGLTATEGQTLSEIVLPKGFAWLLPSETVGTSGERVHLVSYTPEDTQNYKTLTPLQVRLAVKEGEKGEDTDNGGTRAEKPIYGCTSSMLVQTPAAGAVLAGAALVLIKRKRKNGSST